MAPLLKNPFGNASKDREAVEEMRAVLAEFRKERERLESLIGSARGASEQLEQLGEPLTKAAADANAVSSRLTEMQQRLDAVALLATQLQTLDERAESLGLGQRRAEAQIASTLEEADRVRTAFEDVGRKVDLAMGLKERLEAFLEIEKPFQALRNDAETLRGVVDGAGEQLGRQREQNDRLMDAHKLAMSKMEALDRRREEFSRDLQDKERRVASVEQSVRGMDGVRATVNDVKRELGAIKTLGDSVSQRTAELEAQRETVERALSQAENLERAMRQLDAGVRLQQENEKSLGALQENVATLRVLHEDVIERSGEIARLQRQVDEQVGGIKHEIAAARDEMKNAVERFDFESKGLESMSQRVADLRGALAEFENRFRNLSASSQTVNELGTRAQAVGAQLEGLSNEAGQIQAEIVKLHAVRRDLDHAGHAARQLAEQVTRIEQAQPAVAGALRDIAELGGVHALVKDTLEQSQIAHAELVRIRESQSETKSWLDGVEGSLAGLREQVDELQAMAPTVDVVQKQTVRIQESLLAIDARQGFVDELHRRLAELGAQGQDLDERGRQLIARMDAAEQRFVSLGQHAEEAERIGKTIASVNASVIETQRKAAVVGKAVNAAQARCESVEVLAGETQALREELAQRHHALDVATRNLEKASELRQQAATSAHELGELARHLAATLASTQQQASRVDTTATQLEERARNLAVVDTRLDQFEKRLGEWEQVDEEVRRSLEQIAARQSTVQSLQTDLDRMFVVAEQTAGNVRTITTAQREVAESRAVLDQVMERLRDFQETTRSLDERERQIVQAEERLARAEGLLVDMRSSLEALQGQKTIVDQAVEKVGSLRFLLRQAEAMIEGLRDERKMTTDVRDAVSVEREFGPDEGDEDLAAAA